MQRLLHVVKQNIQKVSEIQPTTATTTKEPTLWSKWAKKCNKWQTNCVSHIIHIGIRYCHIIFIFTLPYLIIFIFIGEEKNEHGAKKKIAKQKVKSCEFFCPVCSFVTNRNTETEQMHGIFHQFLCIYIFFFSNSPRLNKCESILARVSTTARQL